MKKNKWEKATELALLLKVIAHPIRLMIICLLKDGELFAQEIQEEIGTTKGNISQHLKILLLTKVISKRHEGNRIFYRLDDPHIYDLIQQLERIYCS